MTPQLEAGEETGNNEEGGTLIFVSDASAEAERLTMVLRSRGYPVIDVPLNLLVSRVTVQRPSLILCDADATAALETIHRVRETPGGNRIDVLFLGEPGKTIDQHAGALQQEASGVFVRPVEDFVLLRKVEALIGAPSRRPEPSARASAANRAPVLVAATRRPYRYEANRGDARDLPSSPTGSSPTAATLRSSPMASAPAAAPSSPSSSSPFASSPTHPAPRSEPASDPGSSSSRRGEREREHDSQPHSSRGLLGLSPRGQELPQAKLSPALESLLASAERRVMSARHSSAPPSDRLSPEAELETILPADVLDALDEPLDLDDEDEDDGDSSGGTNNGSEPEPGSRSGTKTTGAGSPTNSHRRSEPEPAPPAARDKTAVPNSASQVPASTNPESAPLRVTEPPVTPPRPTSRLKSETPERVALEEAAGSRAANTATGTTAHGPTTDAPPSYVPPSDAEARLSTAPPGPQVFANLAAALPAPTREVVRVDIPPSLGTGDAVRAFARVVRARYTGALAFEDATGIRRALFRDGDFVTAASGADGESLVAFLNQRGDLPSEVAARVGRKLPQFGRHAGAALIAQGYLRQDDLWPVLRAHAEWLIARIVRMESGAVSLEADAPLRLQAEPAVFGGATGAEVLVEIVRRAVAPEDALRRLGGGSASLQKGEQPSLLSECAIADAEADLVRSINDESVTEVLGRVGNKDFVAVLYVLAELSVLRVASVVKRAPRGASPAPPPDHLDHAALRARILARKALGEEGDYFALLGVARSATSYDIRRAYSALREEYEPSRILTGDTVDLRDEVELILELLGEAYEILEDDVRRERYRRALDASP